MHRRLICVNGEFHAKVTAESVTRAEGERVIRAELGKLDHSPMKVDLVDRLDRIAHSDQRDLIF